MRRALTVQKNLRSKLSRTSRCNFRQEEESTEHVLLLSVWINYVWFKVLGLRIEKQRISTSGSWLDHLIFAENMVGVHRKELLTKIAFILRYM